MRTGAEVIRSRHRSRSALEFAELDAGQGVAADHALEIGCGSVGLLFVDAADCGDVRRADIGDGLMMWDDAGVGLLEPDQRLCEGRVIALGRLMLGKLAQRLVVLLAGTGIADPSPPHA